MCRTNSVSINGVGVPNPEKVNTGKRPTIRFDRQYNTDYRDRVRRCGPPGVHGDL